MLLLCEPIYGLMILLRVVFCLRLRCLLLEDVASDSEGGKKHAVASKAGGKKKAAASKADGKKKPVASLDGPKRGNGLIFVMILDYGEFKLKSDGTRCFCLKLFLMFKSRKEKEGYHY